MSAGFSLGMAIEIVVAFLLVLTIAYCIVLNRRLTRLRADEEVLRATIGELVTATEIAERAILGLKATAGECEKSLGGRMKAAEALVGQLDRQLTDGGEIVRRIGAIVGAATHQPTARAPAAPTAEAAPTRETGARGLQAAAAEAAERLAAYRRSTRDDEAA